MCFNLNILRLLLLLFKLNEVRGIVNTNQQTANMVIYMRPIDDMLETPWQSGVVCLQQYTGIVYQPAKRLTRAQNMVLSIAHNLSSPAEFIQEAYVRKLNQGFMETKSHEEVFQLRIISDNHVANDTLHNADGNWLLSDYYVLIVDSVKCLQRIMNSLQSHKLCWNPNAIFLVLYHNTETYTMNNTLIKEIFNVMTEKVVYRAGLLYANSPNSYNYLQLHYFNTESCRSIRWRQIGTCEKGTIQPDFKTVYLMEKYFLRYYNLRNCTFKACATIASPFIEPDCNTGIEFSYLTYLSKSLKFRLTVTCYEEGRGIIEDGKWNGLLGKLSAGVCDIAIGGFYPDNEAVIDFWSSQAYLEDSHTWFIKLAEKRPEWRALVAIFKPETWLCFLLILIITWLVWYLLILLLPEPSAHKELGLTAINAMGVSICVAINERPLCHASRILFLTLSIYGLNVIAIYTSQLIVILKDPGYLKQIQTIQEVTEAKIPYGGPAENIDWFEDEEEWIADKYNYSEVFQPTAENLLAVARGERVILSGRMFVIQSNVSDKIYAFTRNVFSSPLVFFMRYGNPFQYAIDKQLSYASDFGMSRKIAMQFRFNNTYLNRIAKMRPLFEETAIVLAMEHLEGPFDVLVCGLVASIAAFLGELCTYWLLLPYFSKRRNYTRTNNSTEIQQQTETENVRVIPTTNQQQQPIKIRRHRNKKKHFAKVRFNETQFNKWKINKNSTFTQYTWLD